MASSGASIGRITTGLFRRGGTTGAVLRQRGGMGLPVKHNPPPTEPLHEQDELTWDDGQFCPEPAIDIVAPMVGKNEGLLWLTGGLGVFVFVGLLAAWNDKASRIPWTPREYPFDNLREELGIYKVPVKEYGVYKVSGEEH